MTVAEAIENILSVTPGALNGDGSQRVRLRQVEGITDRPLRRASHVRGQAAAMHLPRETTAWQAIEYLCGTLSLLVSVQLDEIIVREATDAFANTKSPGMRFIFGGRDANLLSVETTKRFVRNRKGVKVTSYNPVTRETLTAVYPPDADTLRIARPHTHLGGAVIARISGRSGRRRSGGRGPHRPAGAEIDRDVFPANGITSQDELVRYAERIYTERSRQEIDGKIVSPVWTNDTLSLENADRIEIEIEPDLASEIRSMDLNSAARMLERRLHVDADAARVLVRAAIYRPTDTWYAREITAEFEGGGRSTVSVDFINLIRLTP
jgi:hypothetical protein